MQGQISVPKKICILRLSAIGDVCHAVAMVQSIQKQLPNTEITWVIGKIEAALLEGMPGVNFVIFDKKAGLKGYSSLREEIKQQLQGETFDVLLHMQVAFRASIASLMIPAKIKIGFDRARAKEGQWLFTNKKIEPQNSPHVLDGFMGFAKAIGINITEPSWRMPIRDEDEIWASTELSNHLPFAVICPAASKAERNWQTDKYAAIADYLAKKGFDVILCGGPTEVEKNLAADIIAISESKPTNMVGKTSLKQLLAVLKLAHLVIAPDTGPAHMAVTVGTPVIGLYAHSNPQRTGPYLFPQFVVSCYHEMVLAQHKKSVENLPWGTRVKGADLMHHIHTDQVKEKIKHIIRDYYPEMIG